MKNQKGFTVIELLIVLVLVGILVWFVFAGFKMSECEQYRHEPITNTPQKCVEYLVGE